MNVSCTGLRSLPREDQRSAVELKAPRVVVVRRAGGTESFRDILIIKGWISAADTSAIEMDVHHLINRHGVRVDLNESVGSTTVLRADVSRVFTLKGNWGELRPGVLYVGIAAGLVVMAALAVFIWKGLIPGD